MTKVIAVWAEAWSPEAHKYIMGDSKSNSLPWHTHSADLKHFRKTTRDHVLIMGRNTFASLPDALKTPASTKERPIIVLTTSLPTAFDIVRSTAGADIQPIPSIREDWTVELALKAAAALWPDKDIAVIGGPRVLELFEPAYDEMIVSQIAGHYAGDIAAPDDTIFAGWLGEVYEGRERTLTEAYAANFRYTRKEL